MKFVKFDKIDKEKLGKVTRAALIESQSDSEAAAKRFEKYDADKDGLLNRQEFIGSGK